MRWESTRPVDLVAVSVLAALTVLVVLTDAWAPLRVILGVPFLLLLPGYAFIAALFPERHKAYTVEKGEDAEETEDVTEGIDGLERFALSVGLSIAIVPLLGLLLNHSPLLIQVTTVVLTVTGFTLLATAVAWWRRARLPEDERLRFRVDVTLPAWSTQSTVDKALTVGVIVSVLVAAGSLAYVTLTPRAGEAFTEFYVLGPEGRADAYPSNLTVGESARVILGIVNREHAHVDYDVRVIAERGHFTHPESGRTFHVADARTLDARVIPVENGGKWEENVTFTLAEPGEYRVRFELDKPGEDNPYRRLHLWVTVN